DGDGQKRHQPADNLAGEVDDSILRDYSSRRLYDRFQGRLNGHAVSFRGFADSDYTSESAARSRTAGDSPGFCACTGRSSVSRGLSPTPPGRSRLVGGSMQAMAWRIAGMNPMPRTFSSR